MAWKTTKHGMYKTRIYRTYVHMKERCTKSGLKKGYLYYEKGIRVCEEWLGNNGFENFYAWAMANGYDDTLTLDRIDSNKDYCPENCRWVDYKVQNNNTSRNRYLTYCGETHTMAEWSDITGIPYNTLNGRIFRGVPLQIALQNKSLRHSKNTNEKIK